jgi:hypothetical protein
VKLPQFYLLQRYSSCRVFLHPHWIRQWHYHTTCM